MIGTVVVLTGGDREVVAAEEESRRLSHYGRGAFLVGMAFTGLLGS